MGCKAGALTLGDADAELFTRWCTDGTDTKGRRVSAETLAVALRHEGHDVAPTTLKDHRGGRCACYR